jgi:hypothetical protein
MITMLSLPPFAAAPRASVTASTLRSGSTVLLME